MGPYLVRAVCELYVHHYAALRRHWESLLKIELEKMACERSYGTSMATGLRQHAVTTHGCQSSYM
jgi:hypothetical protein